MTKDDCILFLDCEGVMLSRKDAYLNNDERYLSKEKIDLLNEICERTGACVVVTSMWRFDRDLFTHARLKEAGFTGGFGSSWRTHKEGGTRGEQIAHWIAHSRCTTPRYAIVDDNNDMLAEQSPHFVQTDAYEGLTGINVDQIVDILNNPAL